MRSGQDKDRKLQFFVVDGPNNLLGRYALEQLWPTQYNALCDVATQRVHSVKCQVERKQVKKPSRKPHDKPKNNYLPGVAQIPESGNSCSNDSVSSVNCLPGVVLAGLVLR